MKCRIVVEGFCTIKSCLLHSAKGRLQTIQSIMVYVWRQIGCKENVLYKVWKIAMNSCMVAILYVAGYN
jgi:hypothetical protein